MSHNHSKQVFKEINKGGKFSFHPFIADWFRKSLNLKNETIIAIEYGCDSEQCPIIETMIFTEDSNFSLKIGREKEKISKLDYQLSLQKQKK
ncbi:MAG: hypothetical protein KDK36_15635 [Leptospiraceae bacterium]|nr:hypothetical protein [Leptospiraceae bacterium]